MCFDYKSFGKYYILKTCLEDVLLLTLTGVHSGSTLEIGMILLTQGNQAGCCISGSRPRSWERWERHLQDGGFPMLVDGVQIFLDIWRNTIYLGMMTIWVHYLGILSFWNSPQDLGSTCTFLRSTCKASNLDLGLSFPLHAVAPGSYANRTLASQS